MALPQFYDYSDSADGQDVNGDFPSNGRFFYSDDNRDPTDSRGDYFPTVF